MASNFAVKRILTEARELQEISKSPAAFFAASPLESDLFEWHFTVRGPPDTPYEGGLYHGRILLPPEYPFKAPEILILTPNGRFETGTKICLSITSYHQETWRPSWGIRTILTALVGYLPSKDGGLGSLSFPNDEIKVLAKKSVGFECEICGAKVVEQFSRDHKVTKEEKERLLKDAPSAVGVYQRNASEEKARPIANNTEAGGRVLGSSASPVNSEQIALARSCQETNEVRRRNTSCTAQQTSQQQTSQQQNQVRRRQAQGTQERELLLLSYFVMALIIFILLRRLYILCFGTS